MLRRIELEESAVALRPAHAQAPHPIVTPPEDAEFGDANLPPDHPPWVSDAVALSARARALVAKLRPVVCAVLTFWDHRCRSIVVSGRHLQVDPSGSYRIGW